MVVFLEEGESVTLFIALTNWMCSSFTSKVEEQEWPVTPYQIKVYTQTHCPDSWYYVYVDGVQSEWEVVNGGTEWLALNVHLSYIM